jgi:hypothetical protein
LDKYKEEAQANKNYMVQVPPLGAFFLEYAGELRVIILRRKGLERK